MSDKIANLDTYDPFPNPSDSPLCDEKISKALRTTAPQDRHDRSYLPSTPILEKQLLHPKPFNEKDECTKMKVFLQKNGK